MSDAQCSPLHAAEREEGACFVDWNGWLWAGHFGDPVGEHLSVRGDVGVWDISPVRKWEVRGPDAARAVDRLFTNDVAQLAPGRMRYGLFCDENGAIVDDAVVFRLSADRLWVMTARDADGEHLERHSGGLGVSVAAVTDALAGLQLQGPRARELLADLCAEAADLPFFRFIRAPVGVGALPCWIARLGYSGEHGYELFCAADEAEELWHLLVADGARPYGLAAVETLRIESGLVLLDADFVPGATSPFDVSLDAVVRLDKGDFLGRAALARVARRPPRRLVTLVLNGDDVPPRGAAVLDAGRRAGTVTSSCRSPTVGRVIALAVVERGVAMSGRAVGVELGDRRADALVRQAPAYDQDRIRARA